MRILKLLASVVALIVLSGCYACTRHVSTVRPDTVRPDSGISNKYRINSLTLVQGSQEDQGKMLSVVKKSLLSHYPNVFTDSAEAIPLSVHVSWNTNYQRSPIIHSIISNIIIPHSAEQETIYYVTVSANGFVSWKDRTSASRLSETWETSILPIGFLPIPGRSDWSRTFCFLRLGKDSPVSAPHKVINSKTCVRDMVFDPKVDGDVIAASIMRAVNKQHRIIAIRAMMKEGGVK